MNCNVLHAVRAAILAAGCLAGAAPAQAQPEGLDPLERLNSTLRGELPATHLTVQGVQIGSDSLDEVERKLGAARRFAPGGGPELVAMCYVRDDPEREEAIVFQADAKDPDAAVMMAHVTRRTSLRGMARHCRASAALAGGIASEAGVTLGMARADLLARFAHPASEHNTRYSGFYFYDPIEPREGASAHASCQLLSGVRARVVSGRVSAFTVYRFYRGRGC
jgi:hypothetical protein